MSKDNITLEDIHNFVHSQSSATNEYDAIQEEQGRNIWEQALDPIMLFAHLLEANEKHKGGVQDVEVTKIAHTIQLLVLGAYAQVKMQVVCGGNDLKGCDNGNFELYMKEEWKTL